MMETMREYLAKWEIPAPVTIQPCPFCGECRPMLIDKDRQAGDLTGESGDLGWFEIECPQCGANQGMKQSIEKACQRWNNRDEIDISQKEIDWISRWAIDIPCNITILPCPYCGFDPVLLDFKRGSRHHYRVECPACCANRMASEDIVKACETWNQRP